MKRMEQNEPQPKKPETQLPLPGESEAQLPALPDYVRTEITLEALGFFSPSSKRIKNIYVKKKILKARPTADGQKKDLTVTISANHELGLPITSDQDYYRAFLKILHESADRDGRFELPIRVSTRKLIHYSGKQEMARTWKEAQDWIRRMTLTGIEGGIYTKKTGTYDESFIGTLFSQAVLRGKPTKTGKIAETNLIWPAPWFLSNYYHKNFRPEDYNFYNRLRKPIAKALAPLLQTGWYASEGQPYRKKYSELCKEFLIRQEKHVSKIKEQLDPPHEELKNERLLAQWFYHPNADKLDWIITWFPGEKFFEDRKATAARNQPPALPTFEATLTDHQLQALDDIQNATGEGSNPYWLTVIKTYPIGVVSMAAAETRQAKLEGTIIKNPGAHFVDTLKRLHEYWQRQQPPLP